MSALTYTKFELLRSVRNKRFFIFSLAFPVVMYFLLAAPNKNDHNFGGTDKIHTGLFAPQYYMIGLLAFGAMIAALAGGARIAAERSVGWNRQLRLTPMSPRSYFRAKVASSYMMALISLGLLFVAGLTLGVHLTVPHVLHMLGLVIVGLIPFAALGILIGHKFTPDSIGPVLGGGVSVLAFIGGAWGPVGGTHGFMHGVSQATPTYWLVQAGHTLVGGKAWSGTGWLVIAGWTVVLTVLAARAYQSDTKRV